MGRQQLFFWFLRMKLRLLSLFSKKKAGNEAFRLFCTPFSRVAYADTIMDGAEKISFQFGNFTTRGYRWNNGGSKKILIAHGFRSAAPNFRHFSTLLAAKDYEVVAFDAPAHGLSEGNTLNAVEYKNFVKALHDTFGPFDAFLGHSFGALAIGLTVSEMKSNKMLKMAFIAPAANASQLTESFLRDMKIKDREVKAYFYANIERLSGYSIDWFSINRCAATIKGSILWVHDREDKITPVEDAIIVEKYQLPNFRFLFTDGLGHRRIYRDEKVVNEVLHFF